MICLAAKASQRCPDAQLVFFSPDTDVLVLAVTHYEKLCKKTSISMVSGMVDVEPTWRALGEEKAQVLMLLLEHTTLENFRDRKNKMVSTVHES